jgi:hypothetical protein
MNENNSELNINNEHLLLINILNTMYNDNLRQINNLTASNNEIRSSITRLLALNNQNRESRNLSRNRNNYYNRNTNIDNRRSSRSGVNISNTTPLVFDYIIPQSNTRTWTTQNINRTQNDSLNRFFQNFFEPIEVYPTPSQVEAATRIVRYSDILNPRNRACPISLENFNDDDMVSVIRFCSHIFNTEQLNTWFRSNCRCPVCRYDIRNHIQSNIENLNTPSTSQTTSTILNPITQTTITTNTTTTEATEATQPTENTQPTAERNNRVLNNLYYTLLTPGVADELFNFILDPSGNIGIDYPNNTQGNNILNLLNNYQRR